MGEAIGQVLSYGVGVSLSPIPIVAVTLMLVTERARANGPAFVVGWLIGLALVGAVVLLLADPADASEDGAPANWVSWLKLLLGALLVLVALKQFRGRPHGDEEPATPKWMGAIESFTPVKSLVAGVVLLAANPKNLLLAIAAAAAIAQTGIGGGEQAVAYAVFALIATIGVAAPVVIYFAMGDRAPALLDRLKNWMVAHNAVIMTVICGLIAAKLIGDAISGLS